MNVRYQNKKKLSQILKSSYQKGSATGYDEGYENGYDNGTDERSSIDYEAGYEEAINLWNDMFSYSELINLQEKTGYQICYGTAVDYAAAAQAIKHLIEIS